MSEETRKQPNIKKRYIWHLSQVFFVLFMVWVYGLYTTGFVQVPVQYQWILAFLSPFVKEIFSRLYFKLVQKMAGKENKDKRSVKILVSHYVSTKHTVFIAIIVGGVASPVTSYCIMGIDFLETLFNVWRITRKFNENPDSIEGRYSPEHANLQCSLCDTKILCEIKFGNSKS